MRDVRSKGYNGRRMAALGEHPHVAHNPGVPSFIPGCKWRSLCNVLRERQRPTRLHAESETTSWWPTACHSARCKRSADDRRCGWSSATRTSMMPSLRARSALRTRTPTRYSKRQQERQHRPARVAETQTRKPRANDWNQRLASPPGFGAADALRKKHVANRKTGGNEDRSESEGFVPTGIRTRVLALKGPRPRPLDDGDSRCELVILPRPFRYTLALSSDRFLARVRQGTVNGSLDFKSAVARSITRRLMSSEFRSQI